jgi:hypothetical protein
LHFVSEKITGSGALTSISGFSSSMCAPGENCRPKEPEEAKGAALMGSFRFYPPRPHLPRLNRQRFALRAQPEHRSPRRPRHRWSARRDQGSLATASTIRAGPGITPACIARTMSLASVRKDSARHDEVAGWIVAAIGLAIMVIVLAALALSAGR